MSAFKHHVLSKQANVNQLEVARPRQLQPLHTAVALLFDHVLFSNDGEVGLVREQRQHDQVGISAVETVARVGVVALSCAQLPYVVQHFVFTFARHDTVRKNNFETLVGRVSRALVLHEKVELLAQGHHEFSAGGDRICVKKVRNLFALGSQLFLQVACLFCSSEAARSLLVHFGARGHAVHRQQQHFLRFNRVDEFIDSLHDGRPNFL